MRDRDTQRARDGPKRHTNYGLSLPVSILTFGGLHCANCASLFCTEPGVHPASGVVQGGYIGL